MGRRKLSVNEKKNELITIRTTRKEKKIVKKLAKQNKMKISEYIISKIIDYGTEE